MSFQADSIDWVVNTILEAVRVLFEVVEVLRVERLESRNLVRHYLVIASVNDVELASGEEDVRQLIFQAVTLTLVAEFLEFLRGKDVESVIAIGGGAKEVNQVFVVEFRDFVFNFHRGWFYEFQT